MPGRRLSQAELIGSGLGLRFGRPADAEPAFALIHEREPILRWLRWRGPRHVADLRERYARSIERTDRGTNYLFAIVARGLDGESGFAGGLSLRFEGHPDQADLGYWVGERFWGQGMATEAIRLAVHFGFERARASSLCAWVFEGNEASERVLEKNGFECMRSVEGERSAEGRS